MATSGPSPACPPLPLVATSAWGFGWKVRRVRPFEGGIRSSAVALPGAAGRGQPLAGTWTVFSDRSGSLSVCQPGWTTERACGRCSLLWVSWGGWLQDTGWRSQPRRGCVRVPGPTSATAPPDPSRCARRAPLWWAVEWVAWGEVAWARFSGSPGRLVRTVSPRPPGQASETGLGCAGWCYPRRGVLPMDANAPSSGLFPSSSAEPPAVFFFLPPPLGDTIEQAVLYDKVGKRMGFWPGILAVHYTDLRPTMFQSLVFPLGTAKWAPSRDLLVNIMEEVSTKGRGPFTISPSVRGQENGAAAGPLRWTRVAPEPPSGEKAVLAPQPRIDRPLSQLNRLH